MKLKGRREKGQGEPLHTAMYTVYAIIHYRLYNVLYAARTPLSHALSKVLDYLGSILETRDTCGCRTSPSLLNLLVSLAHNWFVLGFREFLRKTFNWILYDWVINKKRNRLTVDKQRDLIYVNASLRLMNNSRIKEQ